MYFLYIPASNQDNIPIFDAGENDLKYNLFSENRFYGEDRLNDAKQITLSLSSSITDTASGNELLRGTIGQIFYLDDRSVNLNNSETQEATSSNIVGLLNARLTDHWRVSGFSEFNPGKGYGETNQIRISYKKPYGKKNKIFNSSYRFSRGTQEEVDISAVIPFNNRLSLVGKFNYSFNNRRASTEDTLEKMFGFEYESCCYGLKFVVRDYWNGTKRDNALYFEFLPKGIATSNNQTAELLREGILGYQDVFDY
jgi:LPS-assembly protein